MGIAHADRLRALPGRARWPWALAWGASGGRVEGTSRGRDRSWGESAETWPHRRMGCSLQCPSTQRDRPVRSSTMGASCRVDVHVALMFTCKGQVYNRARSGQEFSGESWSQSTMGGRSGAVGGC